jgi:cell division protein FtsL
MIVYPDFSNLIRHKQHYFLIHDATLVNSRIFSLNVISVLTVVALIFLLYRSKSIENENELLEQNKKDLNGNMGRLLHSSEFPSN